MAARRQIPAATPFDGEQAHNLLQLIATGGNVYDLAKFAGIFGLDGQDLGAQQTGMSKDQFKAKLLAAGRN
jgi:protocatechuate 4,5-dioxygenase alpha chain